MPYTPGPLNSLFGMTSRADDSISLQFYGQASLFSERSSVVRDTLIHGGDPLTMRSILTTAPLEDIDRRTYKKPNFMFGVPRPILIANCRQARDSGSSSWMARSFIFRLTRGTFLCLLLSV